MELTLTIPDDVASEIQNGSKMPLSRKVLELTAVKAYETNVIDEWEVIKMLGLDGREELYELFKRYDVRATHIDLQKEGEKLAALLARHHG